MVEYVHDSTTLWRIWDPEHNIGKDQSEVIFDEDRNAYLSCPQSLKRNNSSETEQPDIAEEITKINLFNLPQEKIHIEDIVSSGMGESMDHGRTRSMSGTEECMSHGRTQDARSLDDRNPAARANSDHSKTGHKNNGHEHRRPPDTGERDGHHIYSHVAPDEDADIYTEGQSGHCPTLESHNIQALSREEVIANRNSQRHSRRVAAATKKATKQEKKAPVPTDRVTRSAGREQANLTEPMNTALASTTVNDDPRTYNEAMLPPQKKNPEADIMDEYNSIRRNETF